MQIMTQTCDPNTPTSEPVSMLFVCGAATGAVRRELSRNACKVRINASVKLSAQIRPYSKHLTFGGRIT